jgi:S1/P1 Nuclease
MRSIAKLLGATCLALTLGCGPGFGWGNEGHEIIATVAASLLEQDSPDVLKSVKALLAKDTSDLTDHDIASEATWADAFRESTPAARAATRQWHFVDIDFDTPDIKKACFEPVPPADVASEGPASDCVVHKIEGFKAELADPDIPRKERILALKFLLHFVGDVHQPLHAAQRVDPDTKTDDAGGNCVGILHGNATVPVRLHSYWDTTLVQKALSKDVDEAADKLSTLLTKANLKKWSGGEPSDWAKESYQIAKKNVYAGVVDQEPEIKGFMFKDRHGQPDTRCGPSKVFRVDTNYDTKAKDTVKEQLAKAGARLAGLLKEALE